MSHDLLVQWPIERSSYVTLPWQQNFWMTRNQNKVDCFKLRRSYLISFNLSNVREMFSVKSERNVSKVRKRKRNFLMCCAHLIH